MGMEKLDGETFKTLLANGYQYLLDDIDRINALNVFPVPDGDTGTNMKLTIEGGIRAVSDVTTPSIGAISKTISRAMTMSARGNSGVILSQFFKGLSIGLQDKDSVDPKELTYAFEAGVSQAYKVVNNPTEGTMLTVMREATQEAMANINNFTYIEDFFQCFIKKAHESLENTPELLPVLKEAGVIDSGGAGYNRIIEGMISALDGNILKITYEQEKKTQNVERGTFNADSVLEYGYCTEFILQLLNSKVDIESFDVSTITSFLQTIGDSIVAFKDEDIVKVHVHTMTPGKVIDFCQQFGEYITFKMENMSVQHSSLSGNEKKVHKKYAVVAVSSGQGISDEFKKMGCDVIVNGGQTMNPATNDFIQAFKTLDAEYIYVFPNNSNIIMAAKQAASAYKDAKVIVIETKSIVTCYSCLSMLDFTSDDPSIIEQIFTEQANNVTYGSITYSIRDSVIDEVTIKKGDYMALINDKIKASCPNKVDALIKLIEHIEDIDSKEVITIIYGKDVKEEEKEMFIDFINQNYKYCEVGFIEGKQDVYSFLVAVE